MNFDIANLVVTIGQSSVHKSWIDVFSALLTPTIAILGISISYNQWKIAEVNKKHRLFEERYEHLYRPVIEQIRRINIINNQEIELSEKLKQIEDILNNFYQDFNKYKFLISEFDEKRLSEVYNSIVQFYKVPLNEENKQEEIFVRIFVTMYYLENIEEILSNYLRVEHLSFTNLYNLIGNFLCYIIIFFLPVKLQENLLMNARQLKAVQKFSALLDKANDKVATGEDKDKTEDAEHESKEQI